MRIAIVGGRGDIAVRRTRLLSARGDARRSHRWRRAQRRSGAEDVAAQSPEDFALVLPGPAGA